MVFFPGLWLLERFTVRLRIVCTYDSIDIVQMVLSDDSDEFVAATQEALELIQHHDPSAWRVVKREIRYVMNAYLSSAGAYRERDHACQVDYDRWYRNPDPSKPADANREWYIAALASTVIHESTHGRLLSLGIPYNKHTRERVEQMCVIRERCFVARLHSDNYDLMRIVPPFDPARWGKTWNKASLFRMKLDVYRRFFREAKQYWRS